MIFEALWDSAQRGELLLVEHGMCHWHLRRDGQLTIREVIVTQPRSGIGAAMLATLRQTEGATCIVAKCPVELSANAWYARQGFAHVTTEQTRSGRAINVWQLDL